jgi:hypothetical protein
MVVGEERRGGVWSVDLPYRGGTDKDSPQMKEFYDG